uniref:Proprotein convertase subtilisin/kexin type 7 n=1 Tax=Magallana gigas TaxID=29159 RepID=K1QNF0_MAGGI
MDINVTGVWSRNITGHGVTVAVVDDGVEWANPDLRDNYNSAGSWDLNSDDPDPTPSASKDSNHHGTRCAGEIAAVPNSHCAVGVAYGAKFSGAIDEDGNMPFYAEKCASMLAVTFSSGTSQHRSIVTTDWTQRGGKGCTTAHSGTSAAAPLAAGMLALMLQARPCLTWRDIQYLIILTAQKVDIDHSEWKRNQAGLYHSHKHGFGVMKAWRLVNAAKLFVTITHPCRGDLEITLVCPSGTDSIVATPRKVDRSDAGFQDWAFSTVRCWGEDPTGVWTILITDHDTSSYGSGFIQSWKLKLHGTWITRQQFDERRRLVLEAMDGRFLNDSYQRPCPEAGPDAAPKQPVSQRTLKFVMLAGIFCLVMALYETFEYAACYRDEKKAQRQRMLEHLQTNPSVRDGDIEDADHPESQRLLSNETETVIPLDTFDVREIALDIGNSTNDGDDSESLQLISH